ncbi:LLM class flavin-dependent oxidoreductase [Nocardioides sp. zg-579]|uniref:LLM class flavin-dependent oxidoreductase n=1 Tax=Nocardioides marmotae TaxID=2663857 RepID=A0A6I3JCM7_9ACTN|nr:LLM class flavin-dependent oxidoreductase [Nocardioides marmotae]MCR6032213.1 LLM class flavin-dependent oxidoreductase [Gordonia jinghuaiqii]MTB95860.1 LLM class flavin-dependent oxidoreductase [Nocardioides marmotae]QKE02790.1 LLM class flavin-dependent oxidoreductase [Nocardioides marmotae]
MTLPVMEPDLWDEGAAILEAWARAVDDGPFGTLSFGERIAFDNPETLTLLGAVAAWTRRVEVATTVVVPQLHDPVLLAKSLATADRLCGGRLTVGLGIGGREEDYAVVGADLAGQTMGELAERAAVLRAVWRGETVAGATRTVGPPPTRPGGPDLLVGTTGPLTVRHAAGWADGLAGVTLDVDPDGVRRLFDVAEQAWADEGRDRRPRLTTSFWFALDDGDGSAREQVHRHLHHYMSWLPTHLVDAMAPTTGFAGTPAQLRETLRRFEDIGADEVHLIPTGSDVAQVEAVAELLG